MLMTAAVTSAAVKNSVAAIAAVTKLLLHHQLSGLVVHF